jgi:hypothetical protein
MADLGRARRANLARLRDGSRATGVTGCGRRSSSSITGTRAPYPGTSLTRPSGPGGGCWPPGCRACWATPTLRRRTCGGTAGRCGRCTTGRAWRGSRRRRWRARRAGRSPVPGRPCWRRSKAPRRSWCLPGHAGALVHGGGAGGRVGGQRVDGSVQRPGGGTARLHHGGRRCAAGASSRTLPPG